MSSNKIYGRRSKGGKHGDVFTKPEIVNFMLDEVGYLPENNLSGISIMEPSCGEGEFVIEILRRLKESSVNFGFDFNSSFHSCVFASDIDEQKIRICSERINVSFPELNCIEENLLAEDYLLTNHPPVEIVIGNPPYIRYEEIPADKLEQYKRFPTFYYRSDIYILFFEKSLSQLKPNGRHCFICSNRWMKNRYGKLLRKLVADYYRIAKIINLERADAFQENVLAYPAITEISNQSRNSSILYAAVSDIEHIHNTEYQLIGSPEGDDWGGIFNTGNGDFGLIEEQNFKIGIGIATGADNIFISGDFKGRIEDELLLPVINARDLSGDRMIWNGRYFLNPYDENGCLINLDKYPMAKAYLERYKNRLSLRHKVQKVPSRWYCTIDAVSPTLQRESKILLPDISGNSYVFVDNGCYYPQHNIYYITGNDTRALRILAAILMSDFVRRQLDKLTNHMNGGYARWQSQYLRKLHIPNVSGIPPLLADALLRCYDEHDISGINDCITEIISIEKSSPSIKNKVNPIPEQLTFSFESA